MNVRPTDSERLTGYPEVILKGALKAGNTTTNGEHAGPLLVGGGFQG